MTMTLTFSLTQQELLEAIHDYEDNDGFYAEITPKEAIMSVLITKFQLDEHQASEIIAHMDSISYREIVEKFRDFYINYFTKTVTDRLKVSQ